MCPRRWGDDPLDDCNWMVWPGGNGGGCPSKLGSEGYVARHRQKGCVPTDALRPRDDDESALLHELLKRPWAMIEELEYTRSFSSSL